RGRQDLDSGGADDDHESVAGDYLCLPGAGWWSHARIHAGDGHGWAHGSHGDPAYPENRAYHPATLPFDDPHRVEAGWGMGRHERKREGHRPGNDESRSGG